MEGINAMPDTEGGAAEIDDVREFDPSTRPSKVTRKRRRAALSCTECRRRKRKCDGKLPCCDCKLRNKENECHYADSPVNVQHFRNTMSPPGLSTAAETGDTPISATDAASTSSDNNDNKTLSISEFGYARTGNSTADLLDRFHAGNNGLTAEPGVVGIINDDSKLWKPYKTLLETLPGRTCIEKLVDYYFHEINWQYYALDEYTFKQQLRTWYQLDLPTVFKSLSPDWKAFPAIVFELIATSVLLVKPETVLPFLNLNHFSNASSETLAVEYNKSAAEIIRLLGKRQISFASVIAGFLHTAFLKYFGQVAEAWHALGEVIRDAHEIGLHSSQRDPKPCSDSVAEVLKNEWLIQDRRRIWMILSGWDIHTAMVLGRPATILDDLEPTLPIDAIIIQNRSANPVLPRGSHDAPTPLTRAIWAYRVMSNLRKVQALDKERYSSGDFSQVDSLDQEIRQLDADIPCFFHRYNPDKTFDSHPDCYWIPRARATLPQLLSFNLIALHRPHIFTHAASRSRALGACLDMLQAQKEHFESIEDNQYKTFFLFFGTFDAVVLMASIYAFFPENHPDKIVQAMRHLQWSIVRFEAMSSRNALAKSAVDTLRTFFERLRRTFPRAACHPVADPALLSPTGSSTQASSLAIDVTSSASYTDNTSRSSSIGLSPSMLATAPAFDAWGPPAVPFDWSLIEPIYAMGDIAYNDLIGDLDDTVAASSEQDIWPSAEPELLHFSGDFGANSVWSVLNQDFVNRRE
ncbi:unnamed protein product [Clonostachys rhizophaga]|uniref:Zn(2)-C6 fungal-type domain-containing protein n=1 Tax=Clonostachys rhizophaga TaxID=160324 RepID=A0A9N9YTE8_9HYPO|nr:unnamed protein product [Clonostachys rhizophaga]